MVTIQLLDTEKNVETKFWNHTLKGSLIIATIALTGCGTPAAKNFGGSWNPVNHFREQPTEIPLIAAYTFYAAPMDETLKTMLTRWASDSGRELSYRLPFDVTLYTPVSSIRTTDLDSAAQQLTTIYAAQHVYVSATDRKILVLPSSTVNHALQIVFAPREQQDANDYSDMLGYTTVRKENITRGRETSRSHSEERRALMLPQELKTMGNEKEVFLYEGIPHPVMCNKIRYYQDKYFTVRLLPKVDIPKLAV